MSENNFNKYTFEMVAQKLKSYADLQRKAKLLKFEIANYDQAITGEEMIESMTFNRNSRDGSGNGHSGQVSDRTADTAVSYEEKTAGLNRKFKKDLENDLRSINMNLLRLETYIELLDKKYSNVLHMLYIDRMTFAKTAESMGITLESVRNYRRFGIECLVEMYNSILK